MILDVQLSSSIDNRKARSGTRNRTCMEVLMHVSEAKAVCQDRGR